MPKASYSGNSRRNLATQPPLNPDSLLSLDIKPLPALQRLLASLVPSWNAAQIYQHLLLLAGDIAAVVLTEHKVSKGKERKDETRQATST